ncbi:MAG: alpha/beta hydrolase [Planctomycetota bacterium]
MASLLLYSPLALIGLGAIAERVARTRDGKRYSAPGNHREVGGHDLHYQSWGEQHFDRDPDAPVVVLEAGAADWSSHWGTLPEELGQFCTVIAYDRAGLGWSAPGSGSRDADNMAKELHQLLKLVAPRRKALIVAHGVGTWVARMYAHRYPFETAGLVLLDGEHEDFAEQARRKGIPSSDASLGMLRLLGMANSLGICRALRLPLTVPQLEGHGLPERTVAAMRSRGYMPAILGAIRAEQEAKALSRSQVAALKDKFEFPVRILAATRSTPPEAAGKGFPVEEHNEMYAQLQRKWKNLSKDSEFALIEGAHHYLAWCARDWVRDAVEDVYRTSMSITGA